jgi:hypothetical protein
MRKSLDLRTSKASLRNARFSGVVDACFDDGFLYRRQRRLKRTLGRYN